jgi:hypothetical protein
VTAYRRDRTNGRRGESGNALIYILIAIALLALLTVTFMESSSQQTQSQNSFKVVAQLENQVDFVRSAVQECVLSFPSGDINIPIGAGAPDEGANRSWPIRPDSTYYATSTTPATTGTRFVKDIRCPGNPGDNVNHQPIFGGNTGKFLPPPPELFVDWQWYNGVDGVFFWTSTAKTDAYLSTALQKLQDKYAPCESDTIDATASAVGMDNANTVECPAGSVCFRLWMITKGPPNPVTSHYPDKTACN